MIELHQGDCLELMQSIPDGSVDMVLADLPYGTTHAAWDRKIDINSFWAEAKRITTEHAAICLFAQNPFAAELIQSNTEMFRYEWIWQKTIPLGFLNAKKMPLRAHEMVLVFYRRLPTYHPQMTAGKPYTRNRSGNRASVYGNHGEAYSKSYTGERYPVDVLRYSNGNHGSPHATAKPVDLLEYLIRTYTDPGALVLDPVMGSGSTGVACINTGRRFVGMELDPDIYATARSRLIEAANHVA